MKNSLVMKLAAIGVLILVLLVPAAFIGDLIGERAQRRDKAVDEIHSSWSGPQTVMGPVLTIPVRVPDKSEKGEVIAWNTTDALVLPESLDIQGVVEPEPRYRGIYKTVVYSTKLALGGTFAMPDVEKLGLHDGVPQWSQASIAFGLSDLRGVRDDAAIEWAGHRVALDAGVGPSSVGQALVAPVPGDALRGGGRVPFLLELNLKGSREISFVPVGKTTTVALKSTWPSPGFKGMFLPDERTVSASGFDARWKILHLDRNLPQATAGGIDFAPAAFGLELKVPVDQYTSVDRAMKYKVLFVFFTFLVFFVVEHQQTKRLHPIQYLLTGAGVVLFYLLLLSFSEQMPFALAYALASAAIVAVIGGYAHGVFGRASVTGAVVGIFSGLYAYLYTLLRLEDFALLLGSLGLLAALALVMYLTRRYDWYGLEASGAQ
jgi:inner membrane protein